MRSEKIRIMIAEDHLLFAESLAILLRREPMLEVVAIVTNGKDLIDQLQQHDPDIILLDLNMPGKSGIEAAHEIRQTNKKIRILAVTSYATAKIINDLLSINIDGILYKDAPPQELLTAIEKIVVHKERYIQPSISGKLARIVPDDGFLKKHNLSKREMQIIQLMRSGMSTKEIATELFLSDYTVDTHKKNIYKKLNINNAASLIQFTRDNNI
jgi:DNA-binding NarL/FixJ family response regulator